MRAREHTRLERSRAERPPSPFPFALPALPALPGLPTVIKVSISSDV